MWTLKGGSTSPKSFLGKRKALSCSKRREEKLRRVVKEKGPTTIIEVFWNTATTKRGRKAALYRETPALIAGRGKMKAGEGVREKRRVRETKKDRRREEKGRTFNLSVGERGFASGWRKMKRASRPGKGEKGKISYKR